MLYFVAGPPGAFTTWCSAVVAALAGRSLGPASVVEANTLGEISRAILRGDIEHVVIRARAPGGRLRSAVLASDRPFLVAREDPRLACAELVLREQCKLSSAVQRVASSCGAMIGLGSAAGALTVRAGRGRSDSMATAKDLADHLGFAVGDCHIAEVLDEIGHENLSQSDDAERWWNQLASSEQEFVRGALDPYLGNSASQNNPLLTWFAELFFLGDRPGERATVPIDITGRARCLIHGPDIMLPTGTWSLALRLLFSREAAEHDFSVEVATDRQLASATIRPHGEGNFEADLAFTIDDQSDQPVSIRLVTQRAAFDGAVMLVAANLQHRAEPLSAEPTRPAAMETAG